MLSEKKKKKVTEQAMDENPMAMIYKFNDRCTQDFT
jgi:hypothetical protein